MSTYNQQAIIDKFNRMREFTIEVEVPEGKQLSGVIPYEPLVSQNKGRFKIYATSYDEAHEIVSKYLNA
jgi:hypothetical protein